MNLYGCWQVDWSESVSKAAGDKRTKAQIGSRKRKEILDEDDILR